MHDNGIETIGRYVIKTQKINILKGSNAKENAAIVEKINKTRRTGKHPHPCPAEYG